MKILFVCRKFDNVAGGVEKMSIALMNEMAIRGHSIHLVTWDQEHAKAYYQLDTRVKWHKLNTGDATQKASWMIRIKRQYLLRRLVKTIRPDCIIAFQHGPFITIALAILGLRCPVIAAERNAPSRFDHLRSGKQRSLIFHTFRLAQRITLQFDNYRQSYPDYLQSKISVISNPVFPIQKLTEIDEIPLSGKRYILSVGRLGYQKNMQVLLRAFHKASQYSEEWILKIIGDGEDLPELKKLTHELQMENKVVFLGTIKEISKEYFKSHIFVLSSRWEGFPNALGEALSSGLPAVGFEDCAGVNQLIIPHKNGILAKGNDDTDTLARALSELMYDEALRERMGKEAKTVINYYHPENIYNQWEKLFYKVAGQR